MKLNGLPDNAWSALVVGPVAQANKVDNSQETSPCLSEFVKEKETSHPKISLVFRR